MAVPVPGTGDAFTQAIIDGEVNRLSLPRQSQVIAGAAPVAIDATYGSHSIVNTGTGALTVSAPTNMKNGQLLVLFMARTNTGGFLFNSVFKFANGTQPNDPESATIVNFVTFQFNSANTQWNEVSRATQVGGTVTQPASHKYTTAQAATPVTIPLSAKTVTVRCQGPGGGGGSGRRGAAGTVRAGGGGGSAGGYSEFTMQVADLLALTSSLYVTNNVGGAGGAAVAANDTNGNPGAAPTGGAFVATGAVASNANTICYAAQGNFGAGGTNAAGAGGAAAGGQFFSAAGGSASATGGTGGNSGSSTGVASGGGAGGGITAADSPSAGGTSAGPSGKFPTGTTGAAINTAGANGAQPPGASYGAGGAGGGGSIVGAAGAGGNGALGAGGGGGGASLNGNNSGKGGDGGNGFVELIWTY